MAKGKAGTANLTQNKSAEELRALRTEVHGLLQELNDARREAHEEISDLIDAGKQAAQQAAAYVNDEVVKAVTATVDPYIRGVEKGLRELVERRLGELQEAMDALREWILGDPDGKPAQKLKYLLGLIEQKEDPPSLRSLVYFDES